MAKYFLPVVLATMTTMLKECRTNPSMTLRNFSVDFGNYKDPERRPTLSGWTAPKKGRFSNNLVVTPIGSTATRVTTPPPAAHHSSWKKKLGSSKAEQSVKRSSMDWLKDSSAYDQINYVDTDLASELLRAFGLIHGLNQSEEKALSDIIAAVASTKKMPHTYNAKVATASEYSQFFRKHPLNADHLGEVVEGRLTSLHAQAASTGTHKPAVSDKELVDDSASDSASDSEEDPDASESELSDVPEDVMALDETVTHDHESGNGIGRAQDKRKQRALDVGGAVDS